MRINNLQLKNFKRFTDLTIANIPGTAKLVLLIGANGSGKSSVFDAFHNVRKIKAGSDYFQKSKEDGFVHIALEDGRVIHQVYDTFGSIFSAYDPADFNFIGRSSNRILARISQSANTDQIENDEDRPDTFIDNDNRFDNDAFGYMQIIDNALRAPLFQGGHADNNERIFLDFIKPFNDSLSSVFGEDPETTIRIVNYQNATPFSRPQLIFRKGEAQISYDLLSHGEKQVVVLLLNFIVRREQYKDAIIYIDEMDCHLNTLLQARLLEEIVSKWIPDTSQLWTASHSLGFIDYARKTEIAAIIDLDNLDFDSPQLIAPEPKENLDVYEIAIPKDIISSILADKKLVVAENKNSALYNLALGEKSYLFLPANNNREVFLMVKDDRSKTGLRDRDYLRDDEIMAIKKKFPNLKILEYYTFENYLYHPENLAEVLTSRFDKAGYIKDLARQKDQHMLSIISKIAVARQTYVEFKEGINNDGALDVFIDALKSPDFNSFYPYYNMKEFFDKSNLARYNLHSRALVTTHWFRQQLEEILKK